MTQAMAGSFNSAFGREVLKRPEARLNEAMAVPGTDGQKMSKSYGNTISLFDPPKQTRKRIMSIKTDSTPVSEPKDPDTCTVFAIYRLMARPEETKALEERYRAGGVGYADAKNLLADVVERELEPARQRRERLAVDSDFVEDVLQSCAAKARAAAREVMAEVREACGLTTGKDTHR